MNINDVFENNELRAHSVCGLSKHRSKHADANYDRPGRSEKIEKKYRNGKTHYGKTKTLRSHRF